MVTSSNFKNYQSTINRLAVNRTVISSRFKQKSANAKARMIKSRADIEAEPEIQTSVVDEVPEDNISQIDSLLQTVVPEIEYPIACPVPNLSALDLDKGQDTKKETWFSKLFSLKPQA
ncbi:MAG: hypothetical protein V7750_05105 [Sneathiella sp.]